MTIIRKIAWKNSDAEVIDYIDVNSIYFWINDKHIETRTEHSNLLVVTNKYDSKCKKSGFELVDEPKYQPFRRFIRSDLAEIL